MGTFQLFAKIAVSGPYRRGIFWLILSIFWNIENTIPIFRKHSTFCSFMKRIGLKKKKHVLGTFQFLAKSLYPHLTGVAIFWLILSIFWNVENTLRILVRNIQNFVLSWKQSIWRKKRHVLGILFNFWTKIEVSGPYRHGHFFVEFEYFLKYWKYPSNSSRNVQNFVHSLKQSVWRKKRMFWGFLIFGKIAVSGRYRRGHFLVDFEYFLKCWKYPSNSSETFKILFYHENNRFEEKKACFGDFSIFRQNRCIRTIPAWPFFGWLWVSFEIMKIPFQFFGNIQNYVLSWKQSVWRKKRHVLGTFQFSDQNRCIRTLPAWPFLWSIFEYFSKFWKHPSNSSRNIQNFVVSWKQSVWRKKDMFWRTFQFGPKSTYPDLTGVAIFWLILSIFWNVENTFKIFQKHSKFCSFHENNHFEEKKACFGDFSIFGKIAESGPYRRGHFLVDFEYFLKCWKYPSNSCETFKILFSHENNHFEEKKGMFWILFNLDQNRCIRTLPAWPFFCWIWVFL